MEEKDVKTWKADALCIPEPIEIEAPDDIDDIMMIQRGREDNA